MKNAKLQKKSISEVVEVLNSGGVALFPTDTVYGLIADATNEKAVEKIFKIKKRLRSKPLAVFVKDIEMAKELVEIDERQEKILTLRLRSGQAKYWPGKYTFILKSKVKSQKSKVQVKNKKIAKNLSELVIGKNNTIGLRIPKYKFLNNLLKKINKPLAQTSANISGKPASTKIEEVLKQFENRKTTPDATLLVINLPKRKPSTIIDLTSGNIKIIRK